MGRGEGEARRRGHQGFRAHGRLQGERREVCPLGFPGCLAPSVWLYIVNFMWKYLMAIEPGDMRPFAALPFVLTAGGLAGMFCTFSIGDDPMGPTVVADATPAPAPDIGFPLIMDGSVMAMYNASECV